MHARHSWIGLLLLMACGRPAVPSEASDSGIAADGGSPIDSGSVPDGGAPDAGTVPDAGRIGPHGLYSAGFSAPNASWILADTNIDGVFLPHFWNELEADAGEWTWGPLDDDLARLAAAGKQVGLAIGAGMNTPPWVCDAGVRCVPVVFAADYDKQAGRCDHLLLPLPWDRGYQAAFAQMQRAVAEHIRDAGYSDAVVSVKVTGINERTFEIILPRFRGGTAKCDSGTACDVDAGTCTQSDILGDLLDAGYDTANMTQAYLALANGTRAAFPGLPLGVSVSTALPPTPDAPDLATALILAAIHAGLGPLTVQDNGLAAKYIGPPGQLQDPGTAYAHDAGIPIGYQMLGSVAGNPVCAMGLGFLDGGADAGCPESVLFAAIDHGLSEGAQWLEIFQQDLKAFPDAGAYAHARLSGR